METRTARIEIEQHFQPKRGEDLAEKNIEKGCIGRGLHVGTPRKGLAKQDRPFWNIQYIGQTALAMT